MGGGPDTDRVHKGFWSLTRREGVTSEEQSEAKPQHFPDYSSEFDLLRKGGSLSA